MTLLICLQIILISYNFVLWNIYIINYEVKWQQNTHKATQRQVSHQKLIQTCIKSTSERTRTVYFVTGNSQPTKNFLFTIILTRKRRLPFVVCVMLVLTTQRLLNITLEFIQAKGLTSAITAANLLYASKVFGTM